MVQSDDQRGPALSAYGDQIVKGKHRINTYQPERQTQPTWVGFDNISVAHDGPEQFHYSPSSQNSSFRQESRTVTRPHAQDDQLEFEHEEETSTIRYGRRGGDKESCTADELIHYMNRDEIWRAIDRLSVDRAARSRSVHDANSSFGSNASLGPRSASFTQLQSPLKPDRSMLTRIPKTESLCDSGAQRPPKRGWYVERESDTAGSVTNTDPGDTDVDNDDDTSEEATKFVSIPLRDEKAVKKYFTDACDAMQQLAIKWILKEWIKAIEPKKQSTHPYSNGRSVRQKGQDGVAVAQPSLKGPPPWWPKEVRFKEPDHLKKPERMDLVWTIINSCDDKGQTKARSLLDEDAMGVHPWTELLEGATKERKKLKTMREDNNWGSAEARRKFARRNQILDNVYKMLRHWEDFKNDNFDGSTRIDMPDPLPKPPRSKKASSRKVLQQDLDIIDPITSEGLPPLPLEYYPEQQAVNEASYRSRVAEADSEDEDDGNGYKSERRLLRDFQNANIARHNSLHHSTAPILNATIAPPRLLTNNHAAHDSRIRSATHPQSQIPKDLASNLLWPDQSLVKGQEFMNQNPEQSIPPQPLTTTHLQPYGPAMTWPPSQGPHPQPHLPYEKQVARCDLGHSGQPIFDPIGLQTSSSFHPGHSIDSNYLTTASWNPPYMHDPAFGMTYERPPSDAATSGLRPQVPHDPHFL